MDQPLFTFHDGQSAKSSERLQNDGKTGAIFMRETMTPREAAEYLNIHVRTIYRLAKNGLIPASKVGGRWRLKKATLDEWLLEDRVQR